MQTVLTPELKYEIVELIDTRIREKHVTKEDFSELKNIVKDLGMAQRRTEIKVEELAEAQRRTEVKVKELAEAQRRTEAKVEELAEAQKRTELRVEELARAQKETQEEIKVLSGEIKVLSIAMNSTRKDLGGITSTLGFMLENEAYRMLPGIFKDRYGIEIKERFLRRSIKSFGVKEEGEINIFSQGVYKDRGKEVVIIGEAKSQLGKEDIDNLLNIADKLKKIDKKAEKFLLAVTHYARETVIEYARNKGVEVIQSFEW